ncbi:MAG: ATP-binding protein [Gammaproteobacteria bacterium]
MRSLRTALLTWILSATLCVWLIVSVMVFLTARAEINSVFDAHLAQSARVLLSLISGELLEQHYGSKDRSESIRAGVEEVNAHLAAHRYSTELAFQFSVADGAHRFHSVRAPDEPLSDDTDGFSDTAGEEGGWRVYTAHDPSRVVVVRVAELHSVRNRLLNELTVKILGPPIAALILLALILWHSVSISLQPLRRLATVIRGRGPERMDPLDTGAVQTEVRPLVDAINVLVGRLTESLEKERRFTADAAHELRTPLAGLKTHAQLALRTDSDATRRKALEAIDTAVSQAAHLVGQLLALARMDAHEFAALPTVDLAQVAADGVDAALPSARARGIHLDFSRSGDCGIPGHGDALSIMVRNLLDNAIRYTSDEGRVEARVAGEDGRVTLVVVDNGPGIPADQRDKVLQRFYRGAGRDIAGVGIGLSIVQRIVEMHGAQLGLEEAQPHGLRAVVTFRTPVAVAGRQGN